MPVRLVRRPIGEKVEQLARVALPVRQMRPVGAPLCVAAGFQPKLVATVDDVATALGLVSIGWGITVAPDLTPANPESGVQRIRLRGLEAVRHSILIVRDGDELLPHMAAVIAAVHVTSDEIFRRGGSSA